MHAPLDNPIWNALNSRQVSLAVGDSLARRYPDDVGPLSGLAEQSDAAYHSLHSLAGMGGVLVQFLEAPPEARQGWTLIRGGLLSQMVWSGTRVPESLPLTEPAVLRMLTAADARAMVELAGLTEPGPFRMRTLELGSFFGIFVEGRLMAMAGQRLRLPGVVEASAVCTHPEARGRGYARALLARVMAETVRGGDTPMLHVFADNRTAVRLYKELGFVERRTLHLAVLQAE